MCLWQHPSTQYRYDLWASFTSIPRRHALSINLHDRIFLFCIFRSWGKFGLSLVGVAIMCTTYLYLSHGDRVRSGISRLGWDSALAVCIRGTRSIKPSRMALTAFPNFLLLLLGPEYRENTEQSHGGAYLDSTCLLKRENLPYKFWSATHN